MVEKFVQSCGRVIASGFPLMETPVSGVAGPRRNRTSETSSGRRLFRLSFLALCIFLGPPCTNRDQLIPPFTLNWSVVAGDVNGDGKVDLVYTSCYIAGPPPHPGYVSILFQDPSTPGVFLPPVTYPAGNDPDALVLADLDGDGHPDIVVGSSDHTVLVDLNGDGKPDIAVAEGLGVTLFFQNPLAPGQFLPPNIVHTGSIMGRIAVGDLDGDTKPDLVATTPRNVLVFLQDPATPGAFLPPQSYAAGIQPLVPIIQDLNGDGKPDLAVVNEGPSPSGSRGSLSLLFQDPLHPGQFQSAVPYATGIWSMSVAAADLNGDGRTDLVVGNNGTIGGGISISVFFQDSVVAGDFGTAQTLDLPSDSGAWSIVAVDLNGDGYLDLVVDGGSIGVSVLLQDPSHPGQFMAPTVIWK